jgi:hypothetical protein
MLWPTTGSHRPGGVFMATGPGIAPGVDVGDVRLVDLAPTWCARAGHPLSRGTDVIRPHQRVDAPSSR